MLHGIAACCETYHGCRIDIAEDGDRPKDLVLGKRSLMLKRSSRDRTQDIDGDGADPKFVKGQGHIDAILPSFTHSDDTARTDRQSCFLCSFYDLKLIFKSMSRTDVWEVSS